MDKFHSDPTIMELMNTVASLLPAVEAIGEKYSPVGRLAKIQDALDRLHSEAKTVSQTEQLMLPTLGSQVRISLNVASGVPTLSSVSNSGNYVLYFCCLQGLPVKVRISSYPTGQLGYCSNSPQAGGHFTYVPENDSPGWASLDYVRS